MMESLLVATNAVACLVLFFVAASFFFARGEPHDIWGLMLQLGLIVLMAASLASPVAVLQAREVPAWWAVGQRAGGAVVALCLYDWRFGILDQVRGVLSWPGAFIARVRNVRDQIAHARSQRKVQR